MWDVELFPVNKLDEKILLGVRNCFLNKLRAAIQVWKYTSLRGSFQVSRSGIIREENFVLYGSKSFIYYTISPL
jgi:hypothetical protein